jgi:hypothetical protein
MPLGTAAERRRDDRVATQVDVEALVLGRLGRATVSNLSVNGCRIETSNGFVFPGDPIILRLPGTIRVVGTVVWREGRDAGVEFRSPLHPAVVAHLGFRECPTVPTSAVRDDLVGLERRVRSWRAGVLGNPAEVYRFFS